MKADITTDWHRYWNPKAYLQQYYKTPVIPTDEVAIFKTLIPYLNAQNRVFERAIDVGSSATLHHEIPLTPFVQELYVSDYLQANLDEMKKWLNGDSDAHNWDIYIEGVLRLEGMAQVAASDIEARKQLMKGRIRQPILVDIAQKRPLGSDERFPLVTAFYVAESVAQNKAEWLRYMENISSLVADDGVFIVSALRNADSYQVGSAYFPSAHIDEHDISEALEHLGFMPIIVQVAPVQEWLEEGFDSIVIAVGEKRVTH